MISDLQIPFEHEGALEFCLKVQKEFKIAKTNIICVGDEIDQYFASRFPKDPNATHTPKEEIRFAREKLRAWYRAFPFCRVAISNHGLRWLAKATECYIPEDIIIPYKEILGAPTGWVWYEEILVKAEHPFRVIHGLGYSGINGARNACIDAGISTAIGHIHSHAAVFHVRSSRDVPIWGMNVGCLIDDSQYAFKYSKFNRHKAILSCGVVLNDGKTPVIIPYGAL